MGAQVFLSFSATPTEAAEAAEAAAAATAKGGGESATGDGEGEGGNGDKSWQTFLFFSRFLEKSWRQLRKKMRKVKEAEKEGRERL